MTEQEEKNYVYAVSYSAQCPTNLNEKLFDKLIVLKFYRQRSEQIFSAKDTLIHILFYILEFK